MTKAERKIIDGAVYKAFFFDAMTSLLCDNSKSLLTAMDSGEKLHYRFALTELRVKLYGTYDHELLIGERAKREATKYFVDTFTTYEEFTEKYGCGVIFWEKRIWEDYLKNHADKDTVREFGLR